MKEISLHILDLVQNSIQAGATEIAIDIIEDKPDNLFSISISDNGKGMNTEELNNILNPFYTTKGKKTGLGIPLLKQHAEMAGGSLSIQSKPGQGTVVEAVFEYYHFDRQPLGDITGTITGLIRAYPTLNFTYKHKAENKEFVFNTKAIKEELDDIPINSQEIIHFLEEMFQENLKELGVV